MANEKGYFLISYYLRNPNPNTTPTEKSKARKNFMVYGTLFFFRNSYVVILVIYYSIYSRIIFFPMFKKSELQFNLCTLILL